jgi:hypothetical protein
MTKEQMSRACAQFKNSEYYYKADSDTRNRIFEDSLDLTVEDFYSKYVAVQKAASSKQSSIVDRWKLDDAGFKVED